MVNETTIGDSASTMYVIKWDGNEDGPDSRVIDSSHDFCNEIVSQAYEDPDATVERI